MSGQEKFILPLKEVSAIGSKFRIIKPSKKKWILNIAIFITFYGFWYLALALPKWDKDPQKSYVIIIIILLVTISIISPILSIFLWNWIGRWVAKKLVYQTLKIKHEGTSEIKEMLGDLKKENKYKRFKFLRVVFSAILNIDINPNTQYYLEEEAFDSDVSSIRVFLKTRMYDLITSSFSISILIAMIIRLSGPSSFFIGFIAGAFVVLCSPMLAAWITPLVWAIEDARISYINENNEIYHLAERMRRSIISRFFSLSAFLSGIIFFTDVFRPIFGASVDIKESILLFLIALGIMFVVVILLSGTSFLVGTLYLSVFHEKNVNDLRDNLSHFLKYAQSNAIYSKYYEDEMLPNSG